jgi:diguanylate cyclase (GGDEF)-like protein
MAAALWEDDLGSAHKKTLPTISLASALLLLPALLVYQTINFQSIYPLLIVPTLLALLLLILRVSILLRVSRQLSSESHLAITDELTGLANRRRLVAELSTLADNEGAFLLLDLDGFKPINDQYGHLVGDQLLQEVAERFKRALPSDALIGRLGGDEFGVIIRGNYEETLEGAYALRASLSYPFTLSGQKISVGVSIGHIQNDGGGELLERADLAMYEAKRSELGVVQS